MSVAGRFSVVDIGGESAKKEEEREHQYRTSVFSFGDMNEKLNDPSDKKTEHKIDSVFDLNV